MNWRGMFDTLSNRLPTIIAALGVAVLIAVILSALIGKMVERHQEAVTISPQKGVQKEAISHGEVADSGLDLPTLVKNVGDSIVAIRTYDKENNPLGEGTGFFLKQNQIITNFHVISGADHAEAKTKQGTFLIGQSLAEDADHDLILLSIIGNATGSATLQLSETVPEVGEKIFVIGNPMGLESTVSDGIVSARRDIQSLGQVIQITSPISPGSSGSPVFNMKGQVVGIASFQLVAGQNLNFAIPIGNAVSLGASEPRSVSQVRPVDNTYLESLTNPFDRGEYLLSVGMYDAAAGCFDEVVRKDMRNARAHYRLGMCYESTNNVKAISELKIAIELDSMLADAHYRLGTIYESTNREPDAIQAFKAAIEADPLHHDALVALGAIYLHQKHFETAVSVLEKALDAKEDSKGVCLLGWAYAGSGKFMEAIRFLQMAIELDAENRDAYKGLALVSIDVKNWKMGIQCLNTALTRYPADSELHYLLGLLHVGNNDRDAATIEARTLIELKDNDRASKLYGAISKYCSRN